MPHFHFYSIVPEQLLSLRQQVSAMIASNDLAAWGKLYEKLSIIRPPPRFGVVRGLSVQSKPLTECSYYSSRPDLLPDALPDGRSVDWLLRELAIMTALHNLRGGWDKFNIDFVIHANDHILRKGRPDLHEEYEHFKAVVLGHEDAFPGELDFLRQVDGYNSFLTHETIADVVAREDRSDFLETCAATFDEMTANEPIWRHLADEVRRISLFLRLMTLHPKVTLVYTELAT